MASTIQEIGACPSRAHRPKRIMGVKKAKKAKKAKTVQVKTASGLFLLYYTK